MDCSYDQKQGKWHVKIKGPDGNIFEDTSDVLITARGGLNHIAWPSIDGLRSFQGEIMHSADWNEKSVIFRNLRRHLLTMVMQIRLQEQESGHHREW